MSINITSSSKSTVSSVSSQPRDGKGRFVSMPVRCDIPKAHDVTNLDSAPNEIKEQILENSRKLNEKEVKELRYLLMDEIESMDFLEIVCILIKGQRVIICSSPLIIPLVSI